MLLVICQWVGPSLTSCAAANGRLGKNRRGSLGVCDEHIPFVQPNVVISYRSGANSPRLSPIEPFHLPKMSFSSKVPNVGPVLHPGC